MVEYIYDETKKRVLPLKAVSVIGASDISL